ncbi:Pumilio-family RNA binding repeat [Ceratobasidium sp. AG-Ba]|nr:Pumilio-family RNA binding repeat [Ceratobasidium sp. AG-Ba]
MLSASSAAFNLTPLSPIPPRGSGPKGRIDPFNKSSEWPQFSGAPRPNDAVAQLRIRNATNPGQLADQSHLRSVCSLGGKAVGLGDVALSAQEQNGSSFNMNRLSGAHDTPVSFNSIQGGEEYFFGNMNGEMAASPRGARNGAQSGSTALYQHNGSRYALALGNGRFMSQENNNKMGELHGTKHKHGDIDREGTRLEDLVGEIPALCKDQYGCRYLQKKLEEGVPEHRDIIFREASSLFVELMTDPLGNYLCQKLLEYSTDEQLNMICDAVQKIIDFLSTQRQVVQYNLDLNDSWFSNPAIRQFVGKVCALSVQKFSSNVIEKCIRAAEHNTRKMLIDELLHRNCLEKLLRGSFGSYCVQTALDYAEPTQRMLLVECI